MTSETEKLIQASKQETQARQHAENQLRQVTGELANLRSRIPPGFQTDVAEIGALRDLNHISERDIVLLQQQNDALTRHNADMVEDAEKKLLDMHKLYDEKRLLL